MPVSRYALLRWPLISVLLLAAAFLHAHWTNPVVTEIGDFFSHEFYLSYIVLSIFLLLWSVWHGQSRRILWWPVLVSIYSFCCLEGLKLLTRLPRPNHQPDGFPSGHTTYSFALAWLLTQTYPKLTPLWYAVAMSVGWSRVEGRAHYPYQVFCGVILGTVIGWWVSREKKDEGAKT